MKITSKDSINLSLLKSLKFKQKHVNQESLHSALDSLSILFEKIGYLNNRLDTIVKKDSIFTARFDLGTSTKMLRIFYQKNPILTDALPLLSKNITDTYFELSIDKLEQSLNDLIMKFEEKGNSFTKIQLSDINIADHYISAKLNLKTSTTRTIDRLIINGIDNFPKNYIKNHFKNKKTLIFNQKNLDNLSRQINALPFVGELKPPEVLFTNDSTYVYIYVKKKRSNKFDGLIGFFSNQDDSKLRFNGYLDVTLNNIFNGGENILLNWSNNGNERQLFRFTVATPYIFNSQFTPKVSLNIYKQDSTFINTTSHIELKYNLNYKNVLGLSFMNESSTDLLDTSINNITNYTTNLYGITYSKSEFTQSLLFPLKLQFLAGVFIGNRTSKRIATKQTKLNMEASYLWSLNVRNKIFLRSMNSLLVSDNYLINELYRIGGVNTIRGFNEESILSSTHSIFNVEYRYTPNATSYLYSITDFAYVENKLESRNQKIYSFGLGYAFRTNFGLLNLSYALGKADNLPFNFTNSRFHLKIISLF